jgi:hypothetical protein
MERNNGTLWVIAERADGSRESTMQRSSISPGRDATLCYKALEFDSAATRDGRTFVCALIPTSRWRLLLLRLAGVSKRDINLGGKRP